MKETKLVFDMDGTIADLYGVENWLSKVRNEDPAPYIEANPLYDMEYIRNLLLALKEKGFTIAVTTWLPLASSKDYSKQVRIAKKEWLQKYNFPYDELHIVKYGTPKQYVTKGEYQILFDDDERVREKWSKGCAVNANYNIIGILECLSERDYDLYPLF